MRKSLIPILFGGRWQGGTLAGRLLGNEPMGASFDFANDQVLVRGGGLVPDYFGSVQNAIDASVISFTRATSASRINASGDHEIVSSGVWRRQYSSAGVPLGYLPEPQRTNSLRNNTMAGASAPSTLPTNWSMAATGGGLTMSVVGTGTNQGRAYIDIRLSGTTSDTTTTQISFETTTGIAASNGQTWTESAFVALVAGSLNGLNAVQLGASVRPADGSSNLELLTGSSISGSLTATLTRFSAALTTTNASTGRIVPRLFITQSSGQAVDITLRIGLPQMELGAYATSPIETSSAAVTRNADVMTVALSKLPFSATEGSVVVTARSPHDETSFSAQSMQIDGGSNANRVYFFSASAGNAGRAMNSLTASVTQASISANSVSSSRYKEAGAWKADDFEFVANGASKGTDTSGTVPSSLTTMRIGHGFSATDALWFGAPIESLVYIPRRLSAAEMIARTAA